MLAATFLGLHTRNILVCPYVLQIGHVHLTCYVLWRAWTTDNGVTRGNLDAPKTMQLPFFEGQDLRLSSMVTYLLSLHHVCRILGRNHPMLASGFFTTIDALSQESENIVISPWFSPRCLWPNSLQSSLWFPSLNHPWNWVQPPLVTGYLK
jgi:hypothetical protein